MSDRALGHSVGYAKIRQDFARELDGRARSSTRRRPRAEPGQGVDVQPCNHGAGAHEAGVDARGSAPEDARAWLLIEHFGPWGTGPRDTEGLPAFAHAAAGLGIRVQLIRRPGELVTGRIYCAWTADPAPWVRRF